jgi:hypothetical protein
MVYKAMPHTSQTTSPSALTEFNHAWRALQEHDTVFLDVEVPDSIFGVRIHIIRIDCEARGLPPRIVTLRSTLYLNDAHRREFFPIAFAPANALDALLICRKAVATLVEMVGGRVTGAQA